MYFRYKDYIIEPYISRWLGTNFGVYRHNDVDGLNGAMYFLSLKNCTDYIDTVYDKGE